MGDNIITLFKDHKNVVLDQFLFCENDVMLSPNRLIDFLEVYNVVFMSVMYGCCSRIDSVVLSIYMLS